MEGLAAEWATTEYHSFITAAPQLIAEPLTQCYGEWKRSCVLTEWMDRTLRLGYSLQFCSIPPPFTGIREANLSSRGERFPLCRGSGPVAKTSSVCCARSRQIRRALFPVLPGSDRRIQAHSGSSQHESPHCTQKNPGTGAARRLVHNHRPEGRLLSCRNCSKTQKVFAFCLPGCSLRVQQVTVRLPPIHTHVQQMSRDGQCFAQPN